MATTTTNKAYSKQTSGENVGTWGTGPLNDNFDLIDKNISGNLALSGLTNSNVTLNSSQAANATYTLTGTLSGNISITWPNVGGIYCVRNATSGAFTITLKSGTGSTTVVAPQGYQIVVWADGSNNLYRASTFNDVFIATGTGNLVVDGVNVLSLTSAGGTMPGTLTLATLAGACLATTAQIWGNTSGKVLTTDKAWGSVAEIAQTWNGTITLDLTTGQNFGGSATGNFTLANPTGLIPGMGGTLRIVQDATGSRTITYGSYWQFAGTTKPSLSTAASTVDLLNWKCVTTTLIECDLKKAVQ